MSKHREDHSTATGGQLLVGQLLAEGVTHLFALPGVQLDWAFDPLIDAAPSLRVVVPRHEQATSYMADGYARVSGKVGTCMMVPGPGVLNALSGLATAYACSSPVVCLAGQIRTRAIGQGWGLLHEVQGQSAALDAVTKWRRMAREAGAVPGLIRQAFMECRSGRPRPVAVELPHDVLQDSATAGSELPGSVTCLAPDPKAVDQAAALLDNAAAPLIWAGSGVLSAHAGDALRQVAEKLGAPVVMTDSARGALSDRHPLALPGLAGRALATHSDVILVAGSRGMSVLGLPTPQAPQAKTIYVNVDACDTTPPRSAGLLLEGDARLALLALGSALKRRSPAEGARACESVRAWCQRQIQILQPQLSWLSALRDAIPDDGVLVNELTQIGYVAPFGYAVYEPQTFITPGYQGTLGYGLPTALGACLGAPGRRVVSINGDGGFGWNLQELATAVRYGIPLVIVVFRDGAFGNVRRMQLEAFGREIGTTLHNPDFVALARAFGVDARKVETPAALTSAIREAPQDAPLLIEVPVGVMPSPWPLIHPPARGGVALPPDPFSAARQP